MSRAPKWTRGLTDEEIVFIREYLVDLNATSAYMRMPNHKANRASAAELGSRYLRRPHVAEAIDIALSENGSGARVWLITKLQAIADSNLADFFEWDDRGACTLKPWKNMPRELTSLVKSIHKRADGEIRLTLHDPLRAVEILAKVGSIRLTQERIAIEDDSDRLTPDVELARRIAFLLTKRAKQSETSP